MYIKTRKIRTQFMEANIDVEGVVVDILASKYGMSEVCESVIDFSEAYFSNGFILALKNGMTPRLNDFIESYKNPRNREDEFHHIIYNDECYAVFFDKEE